MAGVDVALLVKALGGFFAIMNPFVTLPMFLTLTSDYDIKRQHRTAIQVVVYSVVMAAVVMVGGAAILQFFGIEISHFRVAGGIVLMIIGLGMLQGGSSAHTGTREERAQQAAVHTAESDVAFYPLTFPTLLGPGTITAIIVFTNEADGFAGMLSVVTALVIVFVLLFVVLWLGQMIGRRMSQTLRVIMTRLMGMILASISVGMIISGLQALIPVLR
ncbi:MAG: MarC family protein [Propionibacterium sp.]|nr:MarC family protein [Propionibacterium sp.]